MRICCFFGVIIVQNKTFDDVMWCLRISQFSDVSDVDSETISSLAALPACVEDVCSDAPVTLVN